MNKGEHDKICKAGNRGKMRNVEHQNTHQRGTVLLCANTGSTSLSTAKKPLGDPKHRTQKEQSG